MAAYAAHNSYGSSTHTSISSDRSSWGDRDSRPPSSSSNPGSRAPTGRVYTHIDDIVSDARPGIPKDAPLNQCLAEAENAFKSSTSSLDFGRPDLAFKDYLKAYEIVVNFIPQHKNYGFWSGNQKDWHKRYNDLYQRLARVEDQMKSVRTVIKENNAKYGTLPGSVGVNGSSTSAASQNSTLIPNQHPPRTSSHAATSDLPTALRAGAPKPATGPKPESLQGRPISGGTNDLADRFAKLRIPVSTSSEPPTLSMPKASDYKYGVQTSPTTNGVPSRLTGPRSMVNGVNGPSIPPKVPIPALVAMPKPPSPTYSPINQTGPGMPHGKPPAEGRPPNITRQTYYKQPNHGSTSSLSQRTREELLLPYRPTTPNGVNSALQKSQSSEIPHNAMIDPQTLHEYMTKYNVLLVDVRERSSFDEGHIMASSIMCIEPISLREGLSAEDLEDSLVLSPDNEQTYFSRRNEFDILVYYDQYTSDVAYLRGPPTMTNAPALRALHDTLYEFNDTKPLKDGRPPALLKGGLDAWVDMMGVHSLASSRTVAMLGTTRQRLAARPGRPLARQRMVSSNSRLEVRNRRLRGHSFLNEQEAREWQQKAQEEEVPQTPRQDLAEGDYVVVEAEHEAPSPFVSDVDSFLRRFPSVHDQQSMTMAPRRVPPPVPRHAPLPMPSGPPTRPAPAIPRPSYSGEADLIQSQASLARVTSGTRAPLYSSAALARTRKLPRTGLTNFGVTCYMNATLQCLSATVPLSQFFTDRMYEQYIQKNWKGSSGIMPKFYANLVQAMWNDDCEGIKPSSFRNFCGRMNREWVIDRQQDAKEFFDFLVDCLHEDLNMNWERTPLRPLTIAEEAQRERMQIVQASPIEWQRYEHRDRSYVSSLFAGQHASRLRCLTCNNTSTTYEAFYSISIEIPRSGMGNIYDCLRSYTKEEKLSEMWKCPHCKCEREATKQIILTRLPQFLVIHFKRFAASRYERAKKLTTTIDFPLQGFNMDDFVISRQPAVPDQDGKIDLATTPPYRYDAYGVLKHHGGTLEEGHYTTYVKDPGRGVWRHFNDERHEDLEVSRLTGNHKLQDQQAYIVFFQRAVVR
jgi:ubiquitin carboxyl-terminal hydrolase 8